MAESLKSWIHITPGRGHAPVSGVFVNLWFLMRQLKYWGRTMTTVTATATATSMATVMVTAILLQLLVRKSMYYNSRRISNASTARGVNHNTKNSTITSFNITWSEISETMNRNMKHCYVYLCIWIRGLFQFQIFIYITVWGRLDCCPIYIHWTSLRCLDVTEVVVENRFDVILLDTCEAHADHGSRQITKWYSGLIDDIINMARRAFIDLSCLEHLCAREPAREIKAQVGFLAVWTL